jgi:hypothetical protein
MLNLDFLKLLRKRRMSVMKTLKILLLVCMFTLVGLQASFAQTSGTIDVDANVPEDLTLTWWMREVPAAVADPYGAGSSDASAMDWSGTTDFTWDPTNRIWTASHYYCVFAIGASSGRPYEILQSCDGLISTVDVTENLNASFIVTPDYQTTDRWDPADATTEQGSIPSGDGYGTASLATVTDKLIWDGNSGQARIVRAYYGIETGDSGISGSAPVTGDQLGGGYSGQVELTLVQR